MANTIELDVADLLVTEPEDLCGAVVDGYRVEDRVGGGLMGDVYLCRHEKRPGDFAMKVLRSSWSTNAEAVARFEREARAAAAVDHPAIIKVFGFGRLQDGRRYMVTEFCRGASLRDVMQARGRLSLIEALSLARQIALAVHAVHQVGIVHRDLKPENVMLLGAQPTQQLDARAIKLLDFGFARLHQRGSTQLTGQHMVLGTPKYIAPEQIGGAATADLRADLYSLGVILFELLTGRPPFVGDMMELLRNHMSSPAVPPSRIAPEARIPASVDALVLRLLAKQPEQRPASAAEVVQSIGIITGMAQLAAAVTGEFTALVGALREHDESVPAAADGAAPIDVDGEPTDRGQILRMYIEQKAHDLDGEDLFAVLGVGKTATAAEIDAAYKDAARHLDPEGLIGKGLGDLRPAAERILERSKEARATLLDPARRAAYERAISAQAETDRAQAQLQRSLQGDLEYQHGRRLIELGRFAEAEEALRRACDNNPEPQHRAARAWARYKNPARPAAEARDPALVSIILALRERPQMLEAHCWMGLIYLDAGDPEKARRCFVRALRLAPADPTALEGHRRALAELRARGSTP